MTVPGEDISPPTAVGRVCRPVSRSVSSRVASATRMLHRSRLCRSHSTMALTPSGTLYAPPGCSMLGLYHTHAEDANPSALQNPRSMV